MSTEQKWPLCLKLAQEDYLGRKAYIEIYPVTLYLLLVLLKSNQFIMSPTGVLFTHLIDGKSTLGVRGSNTALIMCK